MQHSAVNPQTSSDIAHYFSQAHLPSQQETLGQIVVEILRSGRNLNRKAICAKLLNRLETATSAEQEQHYQTLISLLFGRHDR